MANDDLLNSLMRRRNKAGARKSRLEESKRGLQPTQFSPTVGGGQVQGMQGVTSPVAQGINWGGIAEKGMGAYTAAKTDKQLEEAEDEALDVEEELANEIYQSTLKDDPDGARLIKMAQMGIPGADKALAEHLIPKTQSMAVLMQTVTSGLLDPSMAREVAGQFGVSPDTAEKAASYAMEAKQKQAEQEFRQKAALKQMTGGGRASSGGSGSSMSKKMQDFYRYQGMSPEEKGAYDKFAGGAGKKPEGLDSRGAVTARIKMLKEADEILTGASSQIDALTELRKGLADPKAFGLGQKIAYGLSQSGIPVLAQIGTANLSETTTRLEYFLNDQVLDRMAKLGGNDSNEELNRMRASLPSVMNNREAAMDLMQELEEWIYDTQEAITAKRADIQSGEYFKYDEDASRDYYREVTERRIGRGQREKEGAPSWQAGDAPTGKIEILEILPE